MATDVDRTEKTGIVGTFREGWRVSTKVCETVIGLVYLAVGKREEKKGLHKGLSAYSNFSGDPSQHKDS